MNRLKRLTIDIDPLDHQKIKLIASSKGKTIRHLILSIIQQEIRKSEENGTSTKVLLQRMSGKATSGLTTSDIMKLSRGE